MTSHGVSPDHASFEQESFERKLIEGLWNPLPDVAETCAWSLGRLRVKAAVPDLCEVISERTDLDAVRAAAIRALGEIGDLDALPSLLAVARNAHVVVRLATGEPWSVRISIRPYPRKSEKSLAPSPALVFAPERKRCFTE